MPRSGFQRKAGAVGSIPTHHVGRRSLHQVRFLGGLCASGRNVSRYEPYEPLAKVFSDDNAILVPDPDHSDAEERFLLIGLSAALRVLVVVHCEPGPDKTIRFISARRATRSERGQYAARWHS